MNYTVRARTVDDLLDLTRIWNQVVESGCAFPQEEPLALEKALAFFGGQTYVGVAELDGVVIGFYILHPNNVGRCGHIANASYAVDASVRGLGVGERLVKDSLNIAREKGFRILQFNAVVRTNGRALRLYERLGFQRLGVIPGGFRMEDRYEDIIPMYKLLIPADRAEKEKP